MYRTPLCLRPNVVVIGTGWGGAYFCRHLDPQLCNLQVLSTRNHMVFTPLLPQTTTGTLEFRAVCEPIVRIQPCLSHLPHLFYRCYVHSIDFDHRMVSCVSASASPCVFRVRYDYLLLSHGAQAGTFGIPGVGQDGTFFLREINEARAVRKRLIENLMQADLPTTTEERRRELLHTVVVGGGPTGVEFAGNLADFLREDVKKVNKALLKFCRVTLLEAGEVLGTFDQRLREWGMTRLRQLGVQIERMAVVAVKDGAVWLKDGRVMRTGLIVWSTGVGQCPLTRSLLCDKSSKGRILIDDRLRVLRGGKVLEGVFAIGDCAANQTTPLPTLAAVASRQGKHLANELNRALKKYPTIHLSPKSPQKQKEAASDAADNASSSSSASSSAASASASSQKSANPTEEQEDMPKTTKEEREALLLVSDAIRPFRYKSLGSMVSVGNKGALVQLESYTRLDFTGLKALYFWKSAYLSILFSMRSKLYVIVNWCGSKIFGRDITYIGDLNQDRIWQALAEEEASRDKARLMGLKKIQTMTPVATYTAEQLEKSAEEGFLSLAPENKPEKNSHINKENHKPNQTNQP